MRALAEYRMGRPPNAVGCPRYRHAAVAFGVVTMRGLLLCHAGLKPSVYKGLTGCPGAVRQAACGEVLMVNPSPDGPPGTAEYCPDGVQADNDGANGRVHVKPTLQGRDVGVAWRSQNSLWEIFGQEVYGQSCSMSGRFRR